MVSAVAPDAHILLVEADDNNIDDLGAAVDEAVALGAKYVSNSYGTGYDSTPGSGEDPSEATDLDPYYNHPGVAVVASSGDDDYGVSYPAASQYVTSVGGTALVARHAAARGWSESVWNNAYGGPGSRLLAVRAEAGLPDRHRLRQAHGRRRLRGRRPGHRRRGLRHLSGGGGWAVYGGTSASSPIIAGVYAVGRHPGRRARTRTRYPYAAGRRAQRRDHRRQRHLHAGRTCAPRAPATTARPAWARPTASPRSAPARTAPSPARSPTARPAPRSPARPSRSATDQRHHRRRRHLHAGRPAGHVRPDRERVRLRATARSRGVAVADGGTRHAGLRAHRGAAADGHRQGHRRLRPRLAALREITVGRRARRPGLHRPVTGALHADAAGQNQTLHAARRPPTTPATRPSTTDGRGRRRRP